MLFSAVRLFSSPPSRVGRKLLCSEKGPLAGTLGCPELDSQALADVKEVIASGRPGLRRYVHDDGEVEAYLEPYLPSRRLVVLGATDVTRFLLRWAGDLGWSTALLESRSERITDDLSSTAELVSEDVEELSIGPLDAVVVADHDAPGAARQLATALSKKAGFVGMLSSARRAGEHLAAIAAAGATPDDVSRVQSPLGLDIGGRSPQEIALSVLAGIVAFENGRSGGWLSARRTAEPIS